MHHLHCSLAGRKDRKSTVRSHDLSFRAQQLNSSEEAPFCPLPSALGQKNKPQALNLTKKVEGRQGAGENISKTLQPFPLLLLTGAGEDESALRSDDGEASLPAIPSDALGQVFIYLVPLLLAPEKHLTLLKGILEIEDMWSSEVTSGAEKHLQLW